MVRTSFLWHVAAAVLVIVVCQAILAAARGLHPPHSVFHKMDPEEFDRTIRKMPPFALFAGRGPQDMYDTAMLRDERKIPPFTVFGGRLRDGNMARDTRKAPPYALFGNKGRQEHGKRADETILDEGL